jgi:phage terminase Nu1 subunit (DNA packaging protein)
MAENQNLQSAAVIANIFGVTTAEVENLRKNKVITGVGNPKKYDLLPTIQAYCRYMQEAQRYTTVAELADIFDVSTRRIEQFKAAGIIEGEGKPTRYELIPTCKSYIKYLSNKAHGREKKETVEELEKQKLESEVAIKKSKAEIAQLELKEIQGKMHRAEDVEAIFTDHVLFLRGLLLAMPNKLAVDLAGEHTAAEQAERVKREVHYVLNQLADYRYDADEYKKRVMERQGWETPQEGDSDST